MKRSGVNPFHEFYQFREMSVIVVLLFSMTIGIPSGATQSDSTGKHAALQSDSISSKVDRKSPHTSSFNFSKDTHTQHRFRRFDVNATRRTMNEVLNGMNEIRSMFLVPKKQFSISGEKTRRTNVDKKKWKRRRKRLRKRREILSSHISDDLDLNLNATLFGAVGLVPAIKKNSLEILKSKKKFTDIMKHLFRKQNNRKSEKSENSLPQIKLTTSQELGNKAWVVRQLGLTQPKHVSSEKGSEHKLGLSKAKRSDPLKLLALGVHSASWELKTNNKPLRKDKISSYSSFHDRTGAIFDQGLENEASKHMTPFPIVMIKRRLKRETKPMDETVKESKTTETGKLEEINVGKLQAADIAFRQSLDEFLNRGETRKLRNRNRRDVKVPDTVSYEAMMKYVYENTRYLKDNTMTREEFNAGWEKKLAEIRYSYNPTTTTTTTTTTPSTTVEWTDPVTATLEPPEETTTETTTVETTTTEQAVTESETKISDSSGMHNAKSSGINYKPTLNRKGSGGPSLLLWGAIGFAILTQVAVVGLLLMKYKEQSKGKKSTDEKSKSKKSESIPLVQKGTGRRKK